MAHQFFVKAYKGDAGTWYGPTGQAVSINCNHSIVGYHHMNIDGQFISLSGAVPAGGAPIPVPAVLIPHATEFPNSRQPNLALTLVVEIKDNVAQTSYYLDLADYNTNKVQCNPVPYVNACPPVTTLSAGTPTTTTATITWNEEPAIAGIEYVNNTSSSAPTGDGVFLVAGTKTVAITGLTAATAYKFWIRTICTGGVRSAWTSLSYTTHA